MIYRETKMAAANVRPETNLQFSEYYATLDNPSKARYKEKVMYCGFDPYQQKKCDFSEDLSLLPKIEYPDIVNYLVLETSWATKKQMKAYKSIEAYNFFVSGWVNALSMKRVDGDKVIVYARINHSQRARDTPLKTWFLAENEGTVLAAHCNCMAGLCEACSHVGALLFAVEAGVRMRDSSTCTGEKSKWIMPSYMKQVPYIPACEMDFSSAKKKHTLLLDDQITPSVSRSDTQREINIEVATTMNEQQAFFENISKAPTKPVILSLVKPFNKVYIPRQNTNLPKSLTELLYDVEHANLEYPDLVEKCEKVDFHLTSEECDSIESATRKQALSKVWFAQRGGRITASRFKSACHTNTTKPSKSLIKTVCYPEAHKFSNSATRWGCANEAIAREKYQSAISQSHECLTISDSGLHVNSKWPFLGASPDGIVHCDCCGLGACEIKCPYTFRDTTLQEAAEHKMCCLINGQGGLYLDKKHAYYYQVQAQIFICNVDFCDFIVWTPKDIHIERILPDVQFWDNELPKAIAFFKKGILPELIGKWFTRPAIAAASAAAASCSIEDDEDDEGTWCTCQNYIQDSQLIGCDNEHCALQWFHMSCMNIQQEPTGSWFCPDCK